MATVFKSDKLKLFLSGWGLAARTCNTRRSVTALLYCRSHSAFFCNACDTNTHRDVTTTRHKRVWMCEVCEQAPAAVTCNADAAVLCTSCDRDIHSANPLTSRHDRVAVVPFLDSADSATIAATTFLNSDDIAAVPGVQGEGDTWLIPNPNFLYNDDSVLFDFGHGSQEEENIENIGCFENPGFDFTDSVVPTQSNGNLCFSNDIKGSFQNCFDIDFSQPNKHDKQIISAFNFSAQPSVSSSDIRVVPDGNTNSASEVSYTLNKSSGSNSSAGDGTSSPTTGAPSSVPGLDRVARVMRYREKRKNRKFEKTIRYASRKAYAETRPRIKGRFAKRIETCERSKIDQIYRVGSQSIMYDVDHGGYGVVPSF